VTPGFRYNLRVRRGVGGGASTPVRLEPIIDKPYMLTGVWSRFGVHLFYGKVTTDDIDDMEKAGDDWVARNPGKTVELVVVFPSGARMSTAERLRMSRLIKKREKERTATATVILAEGLGGAVHRSILTGLLLLAPPPHPAKVFGAIAPALAWLAPHVQALCGAGATAEALTAAVEELRAKFAPRAIAPSARA